MRVLCVVQPGWGHVLPMLPLVRQLRRRGHRVRIATAPTMARELARRGIPALPVGPDWHQSGLPSTIPLEMTSDPGTPFLARAADQSLDALVRAASRWKPHVVVRDSTAWAGWIAAEVLQIPHATWAITLRTPGPLLRHLTGPVMERMLRRYRLSPDDDLLRLDGSLYFDVFPKGFCPGWWPESAVSCRVRPVADDVTGSIPSWVVRRRRPLVHVTLGTVPYPSGDLLDKIVDACRHLPIDVLVAADRHRFESLPDNVRVVAGVSHSRLFRWCSLVVSHAGPGIVLKALRAGVPQLLLPLAADQPANAYCCVEAGVGLSAATSKPLPSLFPIAIAEEISSREIAGEINQLLEEPRFRRRAQTFRRRILAMPTVAAAVRRLEQIVGRA